MSQRKDQRAPTSVDLEAYNQVLHLSEVTMRICKVKEKKVNNRIVPEEKNSNNHHIAKRYAPIANLAMEATIQIGALILDANDLYVGSRTDVDTRIRHYHKRIEMQEQALGLTYRLEHIIRFLHDTNNFANSTITDWIGALVNTRESIKAWSNSDNRELRKLFG